MLHSRLDLAHWKSVFPLDTLRRMATEYALRPASRQRAQTIEPKDVLRHIEMLSPTGTSIFSPTSIAEVEQLRTEALSGNVLEPRLPTDLFIFAEGEPDDQRATKVGGRPYWPTEREWPKCGNGQDAAFIAQLNFSDSADVVSGLPGNLLVVTAIDIDLEPASFAFHWFDTNHSNVALGPGPTKPLFEVYACFGHIHRTWDYPDGEEAFHRYRSYEQIAVLEGTKIGGVPRWIQGDETPPNSRFICSIGSSEPRYAREWHPSIYPFLNRHEPIESFGEDALSPEPLMIGDAGSIYIFLDEEGTTHGVIQCY
jgi:hypothetical protein